MLYWILKNSIHLGLFCYHKKISINGLQNIPMNKPVLFLPNHQNALIDVLLVGVACNRKPFFLARSDVFQGSFLNKLFKYVRMIPIYRIRDGRNTLSKNDAVFDNCAQVLSRGEAIVMFPEGNHSLKRSVRPLSKGFTRVLFRAMELSPKLDVQIIPVGLNYSDAEKFPSSASVFYGQPISLQSLYDKQYLPGSVVKIKNVVTASLETLTTHISPEEDYTDAITYLEAKKVDFLNPEYCNRLLKERSISSSTIKGKRNTDYSGVNVFGSIFLLLNLPVLLVWRFVVKPQVPEAEFMATFRFATMLGGFFLYFILLFIILVVMGNIYWSFGIPCLLWMFNLCYVKCLAK